MTAPVLTTDRLTLRPPRPADWPAFLDATGMNRDEAWTDFTGDIGHWIIKGFGWFLVWRGDTLVGNTGLQHPPAFADVELAWNTFDGHGQQGYAPEAARAVLTWSRGLPGIARIVSYIDIYNGWSQRVAEKLGASNTGTRAAHDPGCTIWLHERTPA